MTSSFDPQAAVSETDFTEENQFDLILMDVMMPEMDRLTVARIIRGMKGTDAGKIPIFAMNASAFQDVVKAGERE